MEFKSKCMNENAFILSKRCNFFKQFQSSLRKRCILLFAGVSFISPDIPTEGALHWVSLGWISGADWDLLDQKTSRCDWWMCFSRLDQSDLWNINVSECRKSKHRTTLIASSFKNLDKIVFFTLAAKLQRYKYLDVILWFLRQNQDSWLLSPLLIQDCFLFKWRPRPSLLLLGSLRCLWKEPCWAQLSV